MQPSSLHQRPPLPSLRLLLSPCSLPSTSDALLQPFNPAPSCLLSCRPPRVHRPLFIAQQSVLQRPPSHPQTSLPPRLRKQRNHSPLKPQTDKANNRTRHQPLITYLLALPREKSRLRHQTCSPGNRNLEGTEEFRNRVEKKIQIEGVSALSHVPPEGCAPCQWTGGEQRKRWPSGPGPFLPILPGEADTASCAASSTAADLS